MSSMSWILVTSPTQHLTIIVTVLASHWLMVLISLLSLVIGQCHQPIMSGHGPINIRKSTSRQSLISTPHNEIQCRFYKCVKYITLKTFFYLQIVLRSLAVASLVQLSHSSPVFDDISNALNFVTSLAPEAARMAPDIGNFAPDLLQLVTTGTTGTTGQ